MPRERKRPKRAKRGRAAREPEREPEPEPAAAATAPGDERPTGRAIWSGSLTFGLVTVPIELYSAQRRAGLPLRMLGPDGTPLAREYVCPAEERPLDREEIVRGYPVGEGEHVVVSDEELEALAPRRSRDIELLRFVKRDAIDPSWFERAYFLVPGAEQTKAYALLAETMERTDRAAIGSFVMRDKAHALAIFAESGILRAETLRFGDELRSPATLGLPEPMRPEAARVRALEKAIDALAEPELDEAELRDPSDERLRELAREKRERGEDVVEARTRDPAAAEAEAEAEGGDVVDLMALLKQRLRGTERARPKRAGARSKGGAARPERETKQELLELARQKKIPGRSRMTRAELERAVRRAG